MPNKLSEYRSYGEKLITLFARLLFTGKSYSLTELSKMLGCSKQSVIRLVNNIRMAYGVKIEENMKGNKKYYRLVTRGKETPILPMTESELTALQMCRTFTEHLLGRQLYVEATRALEKSLPQTEMEGKLPSRHFASFCTGTIDYTPYQDMIRTLIEAMDTGKVCQVTYQAVMQKKAKTYHVKPLKIFTYRDALYLHARLAREPGKVYREPDFDPLLAIHRLNKVEMTDRSFEYPADYDFDEVFEKTFGFMKEESFKVEVELRGWAASYVAERIWSSDQKINYINDDKIRLVFSAASEVELIAWILSFGEEARVIKPKWLLKELLKKVRSIINQYDYVV